MLSAVVVKDTSLHLNDVIIFQLALTLPQGIQDR
jgi:hypothetical protein